MAIFAIMFAGRYGSQPYPGPYVMWFFAALVIVAIVSAIVNRKELDEIDKSAKKKDEPPKPVGRPWKCPKCGEESEPQFDACWKCGTARKHEHDA